MKDEIKEILESLDKISKAEYYPEDLLTYKECHLLLDYITNLQEELKETADLCSKHFVKIQTLKDYKSRNEKAKELLKEAGCYDEETKTFCDDIWEELPKLLNILNGDDNE